MSEDPKKLLPAGRHFKHRRFRLEMPGPARTSAAPVGPGRLDKPAPPAPASVSPTASFPPEETTTAAERQLFKRRVALVLVALIVLAVPALLALLLLAG